MAALLQQKIERCGRARFRWKTKRAFISSTGNGATAAL